MKKSVLLILICFTLSHAFAQSTRTVYYFNWSDPISYKASPSPMIKGYGYYSDSLSEAYNCKTFYEYNEEYYPIESWADYYLWYTEQYWYQFENPCQYSYYYYTKDDYGMASYIATNFKGKYYPTKIQIRFPGKQLSQNKLSDDRYIASNNRKMVRMEKNNHNQIARNNYQNNQGYSDNANTKNTAKKTYKKNLKIYKYSTNTSSTQSSQSNTSQSNQGNSSSSGSQKSGSSNVSKTVSKR